MLHILPRLSRVMLMVIGLACLPAAAQVGSAQLGDFRQEAEAFNQQDPFVNEYRAGHYNGYLAGVLDALQGRSVCFRECVCELDKLVGRHLAEHPELRDRPAIEWLAPLLEARFPCK
jgi:hypothetical protein